MSEKSYWVYMLLCDNNTYYTGYTHDLEKRYQSHLNSTGGCKYTRSFKPIKIAQSWEIKEGKCRAMQLERYIKKLSRKEKEGLVNEPHLLGSADNSDHAAFPEGHSCKDKSLSPCLQK